MTTPTVEIRSTLRTFIEQNYARGKKFGDEENLYESGLLDSLSARDLVAFVEDTFRVTIEDHHFFDDRFGSISGLESLISELV